MWSKRWQWRTGVPCGLTVRKGCYTPPRMMSVEPTMDNSPRRICALNQFRDRRRPARVKRARPLDDDSGSASVRPPDPSVLARRTMSLSELDRSKP